jgi:hypothetical protein
MLKVDDIEALFHYSTEENKENDNDKKEKSNRRIESVCIKLHEVRETIYESRKGVIASIQIVNERYSHIISADEIHDAINQIKAFHKVISNHHIDMTTKATVIRSFDFKDYKKLLNACKFTTGLKSISRLNNMKILADKYISGVISKKNYSEDIKEQIAFFEDLIKKFEDISPDNCYVYIIRYDLKTMKKDYRKNKLRNLPK